MTKELKQPGGRIPAGERVFETVDLILLILIGCIMLFPFLNTIAKSFSGNSAITTGKVSVFPVDFHLGAYKYVARTSQFWLSLRNSFLITVGGSLAALAVTCLTAYPLSKSWLYGRKPLIVFFVFTMLFSGGMIPNYLLMRTLGLINTLWVLVLPVLLSVFNMILLKNFFEEIPAEVEESAQLDGASNVRVMFSIVLPMSLPALATVGLFYAVGFWDNYMSGLLYMTKPELRPLQTYLYQVVTEAMNIDQNMGMDAAENAALNTEGIRASTIVLSCIPIMCVYPFLQKYFVKGMRVGSVKG